jgi:hypothetical protein
MLSKKERLYEEKCKVVIERIKEILSRDTEKAKIIYKRNKKFNGK